MRPDSIAHLPRQCAGDPPVDFAAEILFDESFEVGFQYVLIEHLHVEAAAERFGEHGDETCVQLDADNVFRFFRKLHREYAHAGADLDHAVLQPDARKLRHFRTDLRIGDEILSERLGKGKTAAGQ